jgi:hypothetical protein
MKALHERTQAVQDQSVVADVAARIAVIFDQYPMLCGFSVQECSTLAEDSAIVRIRGGLCLADVTVSTWPGFRVTQEFYDQIAYMLLDLMDEQPEAGDLLPGCTFARTLH